MVIGGFTEPGGSRKGFGALLIGYFENNKLHYAGKVGTGYTDQLLEELRTKMDRLETGENPFEQKDIKEKNVHWIKPELVGEFQFTEWTNDNRLRHPSFLGLRDDKDPEEVARETTQST
jgi:bifunctional non-homologous end joining protein LigD